MALRSTNYPKIFANEDTGDYVDFDSGDTIAINKLPKDIKIGELKPSMTEKVVETLVFPGIVRPAAEKVLNKADKILMLENFKTKAAQFGQPGIDIDTSKVEAPNWMKDQPNLMAAIAPLYQKDRLDYNKIKEDQTSLPEAGARFKSSLLERPEDQLTFLKENYGDKYDFESRGDELYWKPKSETKYSLIDVSPLQPGGRGVAEFGRDIAEAGPTLAELGAQGVGAAYGGPVGAGVAGGLANLFKQAAAKGLKVETSPIFNLDPGEAAMASLLAGVGEKFGAKALAKMTKGIPGLKGIRPGFALPQEQFPGIPGMKLAGELGKKADIQFSKAVEKQGEREIRAFTDNLENDIFEAAKASKIPNLPKDIKSNKSLNMDLYHAIERMERKDKNLFNDSYGAIKTQLDTVPIDPTDIVTEIWAKEGADIVTEPQAIAKLQNITRLLQDKLTGTNRQNLGSLLEYKQGDTFKNLLKSTNKDVEKELKFVPKAIDEFIESLAPAEVTTALKNTNRMYRNFKQFAEPLVDAKAKSSGGTKTIKALMDEIDKIMPEVGEIEIPTTIGAEIPTLLKLSVARNLKDRASDITGKTKFERLRKFIDSPEMHQLERLDSAVMSQLTPDVGGLRPGAIAAGTMVQHGLDPKKLARVEEMLKDPKYIPPASRVEESLNLAEPGTIWRQLVKPLGKEIPATLTQPLYNPAGFGARALASYQQPRALRVSDALLQSLDEEKRNFKKKEKK